MSGSFDRQLDSAEAVQVAIDVLYEMLAEGMDERTFLNEVLDSLEAQRYQLTGQRVSEDWPATKEAEQAARWEYRNQEEADRG